MGGLTMLVDMEVIGVYVAQRDPPGKDRTRSIQKTRRIFT